MSRDQVMQYLQTSIEGLTQSEAIRDLQYMVLMKSKQKEGSPEQPYSQNSSEDPLIIILLIATAISAIVGELIDSTIIIAIVITCGHYSLYPGIQVRKGH